MPKKTLIKIRPDLSENFLARDLSWLEFNQRVLQEGLNEEIPYAERLRFLAIASSNLDEFFKVRVAGALQVLRSENSSRKAGRQTRELLNAISRKAHEQVELQSSGIRKALSRLDSFGLSVIPSSKLSEAVHSYLRGYFETEILPILTPLAVEDIEPMPLLPALQLHVALWLRIPKSIGYLKSNTLPEGNFGKKKKAASDKNARISGISERVKKHTPDNASKKTSEGASEEISKKASEGVSESTIAASKTQKKRGNSVCRQVKSAEEEFDEKLAVIPVPSQLSRFVKYFASSERTDYVFLEQVIAANADLLFPGCEVLAHSVFRVTRDEDVYVHGDLANYAQEVENAVLSRRYREGVRLEISARSDERIRKKLAELLKLEERDIYDIDAPLDATILFELAENTRLQAARYPEWPAFEPADLAGCQDIYERIAQQDVMLYMPYEKFTPVVELLEKAASDPDVLAIKQTLYRTSGDSPIVKALIKAARNGKDVAVLVELRARFDESRNIRWTQQLEDAGCHVIYGIAGLKTHAKAMLIIRREKGRIVRYAHLSTGNYNDKTARLYSDIGLMTCNPEITSDVAAFFNILTGYSEAVGWKRLTVEPVLLKRRFIELIEREITLSTPEQPGCIRAKVNALEDKNVIEALYRASQHGVKIQLNVRGICCLRPGVPGLSENIEVFSIIDRFLEHSRIFFFQNGGNSEVYLASSDWMTRNLVHRLEILFPILDPHVRKRILHCLDLYLSDNQNSHQLHSDGSWTKRKPGRNHPKIRAQEILYHEAKENASEKKQAPLQYVPLQRPET